MIEIKDIEFNGFNFRFVKEEDGIWVCRLPTWLIEEAEKTIKGENHA